MTIVLGDLPEVVATDTQPTLRIVLTSETGGLDLVEQVDLLLPDRVLASDILLIEQLDPTSLICGWRYDGSLDPGDYALYARAVVAGRAWTSTPMRLLVNPAPGGGS